jgi:hypothetical protein
MHTYCANATDAVPHDALRGKLMHAVAGSTRHTEMVRKHRTQMLHSPESAPSLGENAAIHIVYNFCMPA